MSGPPAAEVHGEYGKRPRHEASGGRGLLRWMINFLRDLIPKPEEEWQYIIHGVMQDLSHQELHPKAGVQGGFSDLKLHASCRR